MGEILNLIESVSEGFPSYFINTSDLDFLCLLKCVAVVGRLKTLGSNIGSS